MLENLKENIKHEKEIIKQIFLVLDKKNIDEKIGQSSREEENLLDNAIISLINQMKILNNSIPELINQISGANQISGKERAMKNLVRVSYQIPGKDKSLVTIDRANKDKFVEQLNLNYKSLKKVKGFLKEKKIDVGGFKRSKIYGKLSNKFFLGISNYFTSRGHFEKLGNNLRKANMPYLLNTYVSMTLFSTLIGFFIGIFYFVFSLFFSLSLDYPFIGEPTSDITFMMINASLIVVFPLITFILFYFYPVGEKNALSKKIDVEVPFVAIHMSAIAGSGIEPSQIFKIIAMNDEYRYSGEELKKVINQINIYGYDLLNALRNTAKTTSSKKLAELLNGLATTINTGGDLTNFLDKRAESLLFDYRLDREKNTKVSETFMDIYISVIIAAPMIMMMLMILISVTGFDIGIGITALSIIMILVIALINFMFLIFLHFRQPAY